MSLINDALKRASQSQPPPPPTGPPNMGPTPEDPPPKLPYYIVPIAFVGLVLVGFWFVVKGVELARRSGSPTNTVAARETPEARPVTGEESLNADLPSSSDTPVEPAAPLTPPPPTFPNLKLQALFYRPRNPSVVINSQTLRVGQSVDGVKILSIGSQAVKVQWKGETRELVLP